MKGTELVADGLTKPLLGQAFNAFLADLGMKRSERADLILKELEIREELQLQR